MTFAPAFGLLRDATVFVHVEQRHTDQDLLDAVEKHPELLCLGIDTATAIVVQGDQFEVLGMKRAHVVQNGKVLTLKPGDRFSMKTLALARYPSFTTNSHASISSADSDMLGNPNSTAK